MLEEFDQVWARCQALVVTDWSEGRADGQRDSKTGGNANLGP